MVDIALCFVDLLHILISDQHVAADEGIDNPDSDTKIALAQHRYMAIAICILSNTQIRKFNALQGRIDYYLFAY